MNISTLTSSSQGGTKLAQEATPSSSPNQCITPQRGTIFDDTFIKKVEQSPRKWSFLLMLFKNSHDQYNKVLKRQPAETTFLVPQLSLKKASTTVSQGAALEQKTKLPMLA